MAEAGQGESDETMSITCGDFLKVVEYYQGNICLACFLPSFREIFCSEYTDKTYQSHEDADETEADNDTDESGADVDLENIDKWACDALQMANDTMDSINKKKAQAAKGEPVTFTLEEFNSLKNTMLVATLRLATDSDFRRSFRQKMMPQALREIQKEIHKKKCKNMEEINSAQRIVNEALKDDSWDIGVNKIAALRTIKRTASIMETLDKRIKGLELSDPVEITYDELNDLMSLHVANIYLALTSEAFRNGEFAKCEIEACKNYLKHEVPGIVKEIREKQGK